MNKQTLLTYATMAALMMTGCASSPDAKFYTLSAIDRYAPPVSLTTALQNVAVKVGPVSIPDALDQSQIISRTGKNRLIVDEFHRWGGDLQLTIQLVLAENISLLLPTEQVILNQDVTPLPADYQVIVHFREFDGELGGTVMLNADWTIVRFGKKNIVRGGKLVFRENTTGPGYQAYVAAQSRLLAKFSREIVAEINGQMQ